MAGTKPYRIKTIREFHRFRGLSKSEHPLISVIDISSIEELHNNEPISLVTDLYFIALKKNFLGKMQYGQKEFDFDEGVMSFMSPGQVFKIKVENDARQRPSGWMLFVHPDFLYNTSLAKKIKNYEFFNYSVSEALFLSDKEETIITGIMQNIQREYHGNMDQFSQEIIISQIEGLLNYADRFYHRQFLTRRRTHHKILDKLEDILTAYFAADTLVEKGLPSVQYIADQLNVSPTYLGRLLKGLTGQSTQQHIHLKLIEKAKEKLTTTNLSVSEIAFDLGFEHHQSFSKLFKTKTNLSPLEFRQSFN